jgi:hypothetical protein
MTNEQQPNAKPLYTDDDIKALRRFAETCEDGEGYDLPKVTMVRLARIGLVRRCTGNIYEVTDFGSSILEPEFWHGADKAKLIDELIMMADMIGDEEFADGDPDNSLSLLLIRAVGALRLAAPVGEAQQGTDDYRSMFGAAVASLSEISEALGIDEESAMCANGNELILDAIAELKSPRLETPEQGEADRRDAWQPIETIPRDGREVLVYRPLAYKTNDPVITIATTETEDRWCWPDTVPERCNPTNPTNRACHCSHWMPLPAAPAQQKGEPHGND